MSSPSPASMREQLLLRELEELRRQLEEPEELLRAIRSGEVDAFVVPEPSGEKIYALRSADPLYRMMIEQMQEGAATLSADGTLVYCNHFFADLLGTPREQLLGASVRPFLPPPGDEVFETLLRGASEQAGSRRGELTVRGKGGVETPVYVAVNQLPVEGVQVFCVVVTDLTEHRKHQEVVAAADLASSILDQAAEAIVVCDDSGRVIRASRAAHELSGGSPLLRPFEEAFPLLCRPAPGPLPREADRPFRLEHTLRGETVRGAEVYQAGPGGRRRELLLSAGPLRDGRGKTIGCVVTLTDIGRQKQAEAVLREADRRKDEFLAMLAHELRNPLAPMRNAVYILKRAAGTPAGEEVRALIDRQLGHMVRLVDDLLDIARIRQGKLELRREVINLADVIARAAEAAGPFVQSRQHQLTVTLPPEPLRVEADAVRVAQVISNLLNNAAKYTEPGGRIALSAEQDDGTAVVRVRDTGIGIAPEDLPRVFDLFAQVDQSITRSQGGLGVGLTLVKSLVEMHGGVVGVSSPGTNQGAEFTVRLPLHRAGEARAAAGGQRGERSAAPAPQPGRRVLVVDDNRDGADSLALLLRTGGHEVRTAYSAATALEGAASFGPDVIFLDIGLPGTDGYEVARRLRARPEHARTLLVALTGYGQEEDRRRSREAGFDHHFVKPIDPGALEGLLRPGGAGG